MINGTGTQAVRTDSPAAWLKEIEAVQPAKLLLINFDPANILRDNLKEILHAMPIGLKIRDESLAATGLGSLTQEVARAISSFSPTMLFFIFSPDALRQKQAIIQPVRAALIPMVAIVEAAEPQELFEMLNLGVSDFFTSPLRSADILPRLWRLLRHSPVNPLWMQRVERKLGLEQIVGESPALRNALNIVPTVAASDVNVLISGETGTGKELVARAIHYLSQRANDPFIPVNCGAIPHELVENELFGHERGAYTGAANAQKGLIKEAEGGTLFLDEIDSLPWLAQVKLLRFLQEKEYRTLGSPRMQRGDVRVIAASNVDCEKAVKKGKLRQDLYYRLNVIPIHLPTLRERREDIPLLTYYFMAKHAPRFQKLVTGISQPAMQMLLLYEWPGNVRELEHTVERALVLAESEIIGPKQIILPTARKVASQASFQELKGILVGEFERAYIKSVLLACGGNINRAAQAARKNRRAFWQLMRKHDIKADDYKSTGI